MYTLYLIAPVADVPKVLCPAQMKSSEFRSAEFLLNSGFLLILTSFPSPLPLAPSHLVALPLEGEGVTF